MISAYLPGTVEQLAFPTEVTKKLHFTNGSLEPKFVKSLNLRILLYDFAWFSQQSKTFSKKHMFLHLWLPSWPCNTTSERVMESEEVDNFD